MHVVPFFNVKAVRNQKSDSPSSELGSTLRIGCLAECKAVTGSA
jgi:hypothetical protein